MSADEDKARLDEFHNRMRELIQEFADVTGPRACPEEEHDCADSPPENNVMLSSYLISLQWDKLFSDCSEGYTDYLTSPGSSYPQNLGLSLITYKELESVIMH